ncbi:hypothetical protein SAMN05421810_10675 [Amycolatopsis arida]|uniref:Uncharacterized protein n=1 Tax=Amycolatopsis arida TaxID=587909 RepID=A0A1I5XHU3_9PSEU|nr:hypothetical protein [Amycolatopsis arida]TDX97442.1 hypothetical protein CLV69_102546 [Amycolatopsis arida]SFQ31500.1 hypothetical protein SAMN05421810_10675 [Amycolatopsis arida]
MTTEPAVRTKTITWREPVPEKLARMSGREFLAAMAEGSVPPPPISAHLDIKAGSRMAFAEGELRGPDGTPLATASSTLIVLRP